MKMKKALVTIAAVIAAATTANAKVICTVQAEEKVGEYTKNVASKDLDTSAKDTLVHQDGNIMYMASKDGNGNTWLMVYDPTTKRIIAGGGGTMSKQLLILLPELKQAFGCFDVQPPQPQVK
jgi:hypothetical protein